MNNLPLLKGQKVILNHPGWVIHGRVVEVVSGSYSYERNCWMYQVAYSNKNVADVICVPERELVREIDTVMPWPLLGMPHSRHEYMQKFGHWVPDPFWTQVARKSLADHGGATYGYAGYNGCP